jgi:3-oxoacyl-ACP reductase-like protein
MRFSLLLLSILCAVSLAACGQATSSTGDFKGEEQGVAATVADIQKAAQGDDATRICRDFVTPAFAESIAAGPSSCPTELHKAIQDVDTLQLDVQAVTVTGATATARVRGVASPDDVIRTLSFEKSGTPARWRVSKISR